MNTEFLENYIRDFPFDKYQVYAIKNQGKFYIDAIDDLIKNQLRTGKMWEPHIVACIEVFTKPGTVAIDIGAHMGTQAIPMTKFVGDKGTVWAFEPQLKLYRELVMNARLNGCDNMVIQRYAIGDSHKTVYIDQSFCKNNEGAAWIADQGEAVEMRTLDSFNLTNVSLIKIDVENYEDSVLEGAKTTILANQPIMIIELLGRLYASEPKENAIKRLFQTQTKLFALGYFLKQVSPRDFLAFPLKKRG